MFRMLSTLRSWPSRSLIFLASFTLLNKRNNFLASRMLAAWEVKYWKVRQTFWPSICCQIARSGAWGICRHTGWPCRTCLFPLSWKMFTCFVDPLDSAVQTHALIIIFMTSSKQPYQKLYLNLFYFSMFICILRLNWPRHFEHKEWCISKIYDIFRQTVIIAYVFKPAAYSSFLDTLLTWQFSRFGRDWWFPIVSPFPATQIITPTSALSATNHYYFRFECDPP